MFVYLKYVCFYFVRSNKAVCPFYYTKDIEIYLEVGLEDFS